MSEVFNRESSKQEPIECDVEDMASFVAEEMERRRDVIARLERINAALLAACHAGARYSNALAALQAAGTLGQVVESNESNNLDELFEDWHDRTHAILDELAETPNPKGNHDKGTT